MKKFTAVMMAVLMLLALTACKKSSSNDTSIMRAVVVSNTNGMLKVSAENAELSFSTENVDTMPTVAAGDKVLLTYKGSVNGSDTSKATLTGVELIVTPQSETSSSSEASSIPLTPMNPGPVKTATFYGMVANSTMNTFEVQNSNGTTAQFTINDNTVFSTINGFFDGIMVTVTYMGDYTDPDNCTVVSVVEDANDIVASSQGGYDDEPSADNNHNGNFDDGTEYNSIIGVVVEAAMNTLEIETDNGADLVFSLGDNPTINVSGGIGLGKLVTIVYTGTITNYNTDACTVISITG